MCIFAPKQCYELNNYLTSGGSIPDEIGGFHNREKMTKPVKIWQIACSNCEHELLFMLKLQMVITSF